ncbi:MAG TPA: ABC transporter permease [Gemmatimonadaceae bacterium]|jgi:ABC-2 type transport system permease protein|nr:ABC transporter permease [Gemmatimonadaceae bacterium]
MGKLFVVFEREYLERVRSKWFLLGTLLGPAFFFLVLVGPRYMGGRSSVTANVAHIIVLDATGMNMGARVSDALHERFPMSPPPVVQAVPQSELPLAEERAASRVQRSEVLGYLVLDSSTVTGRSARYAGRNASSLSDIEAVRNLVRQEVLAERMEREGIDSKRVAAFARIRLEMHTIKIGDAGREQGSGFGAVMFGYAVALTLYMMIVIYGQTIMRGVMEEKTTRVAEVVVSSVNTDTLLAGKILGVGFVAITQVIAWVALILGMAFYVVPMLPKPPVNEDLMTGAAAAPGVDAFAGTIPSISPGTAIALFLFFVLGFVFYAALFAAVGSMVNSQEDVQQASTPVMLLLVSSVIFMGPIMTNPGSNLARTMSLIPFSAPILMPLRMTLVPVPWYEIVGAIAGVLIACLVSIWLSARIYRVGLLMYGKKPSLRELARWVRYAR